MARLTVGSLFAGVGGFDLGFERAGYDIRWQVEIDPWARRVLEKHWPHVHRHDDIRTAGAHSLEAVDVLCGGFPCTDISLAGKGAGITGPQSGLWSEYARLIRELRPRYVVVENVAALLARGLGRVLGDLADAGYDAEWTCIRASDVGAPHERNRIWLVAYAHSAGLAQRVMLSGVQGEPGVAFAGQATGVGGEISQVADADGKRELQPEVRLGDVRQRVGDRGADVLIGARIGYYRYWQPEPGVRGVVDGLPNWLDGASVDGDTEEGRPGEVLPMVRHWPNEKKVHHGAPRGQVPIPRSDVLRYRVSTIGTNRPVVSEPADDVLAVQEARENSLRAMWGDRPAPCASPGRQYHPQRAGEPRDDLCGVPQPAPLSPSVKGRVDRLRGLGNAVVPQIPEWIARRILDAEGMRAT